MPVEQRNDIEEFEKLEYPTIMMERSYLKSWKIFTEESAKLLPYLKDLVKQDKNNLDGQLHALNALNACKFEEPELRKQIIANALEIFK
jgi:hypothetical protein